MGSTLSWLKRRARPLSPTDLREALLGALNAKDYQELMRLINANSAAIREAFPTWMKLPAEYRDDTVALERYASMLMMLARAFEQSGDASLMTRLGANNPLGDVPKELATVDALIADRRAGEAVTLLKTMLGRLDELTGTGVDQVRPIILGRLGIALSKTGDKQEAVRITRQALELCRSRGDGEGVLTYTKNLETIGTFDVPAGDGTDDKLTVRVTDEEGRTLTLDELRTVSGRIKWDLRYDLEVPPEAHRLHQEGRTAGAAGEYETALSLLTRAAELAPTWPYPIYDRAFSYLFQHKFDLALREYQRTLELAPNGFFTAEVAVDTLTRESAGELPVGFYAAFAMLEHMPKEQRASIVRQLVERFPSYAPAWDEHAQLVDDPRERFDIIERGLAASPDRYTRGSLLVRKATAMHALGDAANALKLLQDLASDPTQSLHTRAVAELLTRLPTSVAE